MPLQHLPELIVTTKNDLIRLYYYFLHIDYSWESYFFADEEIFIDLQKVVSEINVPLVFLIDRLLV